MRRLCTGLYRDVAQMSFVCCVRPGCICHIRRDSCRHVSWGARAIRRSILFALPCPPICLAGPAHFPVPLYSVAGVWLELMAERPLCRGHEVAGRPRHALVMRVWVLPPLIRVEACGLGSSWRGVRVRIPWPPGFRSICRLASLSQL